MTATTRILRPNRRSSVLGHLVLITLAVSVLVPFASIVLAAFQPPGALISGLQWPSRFYLGNFREAWTTASFSHLTASSLIVLVGVVPAALLLAVLAGYGLGVLRPPGGSAIIGLFIFGLILPVELIVIPLYFDLRSVGLANSYAGVILAEIGLFMPFGVFWMRTHFDGMSQELVEAAEVDGASSLTILFRVLLPISWPAIKTLGTLYFMWSWNQFMLVLILIQDPARRTAPVGLGYFVGEHVTNVPVLAAGTIIVIMPILVVYLALQRNFIRGMLQGAVKA